MNYADGPQVITRVLIRGKKAGGPSQRRKYDKGSRGGVCVCVRERARARARDREREGEIWIYCAAGFEDGERGPLAKECRWPSDRKGKETDFPLEPPEGIQPC